MPRAHRHFLTGHVWHITRHCHQKDFRLKGLAWSAPSRWLQGKAWPVNYQLQPNNRTQGDAPRVALA